MTSITPGVPLSKSQARSRLRLGDVAPDFMAELHTGEQLRMADFRGRQVVVLFFYPRNNTSICTREACAFRDAFEAFTEAGAVVIGVSGDSLDRHRSFAERQSLPFYLVSDRGGSISRAYGVPKRLGLLPRRATFVIDRDGVVRHAFESLFTADRHVSEALAIVRQLAGSKPIGTKPDQRRG
jgi:peroxiredoxin Q/BCP